VIKEFELGQIVGQTTGGTIQYYGDFLMFKLPKTGMEFFISPKIFKQYGGNNIKKGVKPDIIIQENENLEILPIIRKLKY